MAADALSQARSLFDATAIPRVRGSERIHLVRLEASDLDPAAFGAKRTDAGKWFIEREPWVDLLALESVLPRIARKTVVPKVVDLIPESSWCASLANMLTGRSWGGLREEALVSAGACEDCGADERLECHEAWSYDEDRGVQTLQDLRIVCKDCHETHHLGFASVRGRFATAIERLCAVNRIKERERTAYEEAIFEKYHRRSKLEWILDLSLLAGKSLSLRSTFEEVAPGVLIGEGSRGDVEVGVTGIQVCKPSKPGGNWVLR